MFNDQYIQSRMSNHSKNNTLIKKPWLAFLSSMRFAVALLAILGIASIIGTVLPQNRANEDYVLQFGVFWSKIFQFLGLYDVYSSTWFVLIMLFLVISTTLCLWRNIPSFIKDIKSYRLKVTAQSLALMKYTALIDGNISPEVAEQYLQVQGYKTKRVDKDEQILIAAKKGALSKLGYIFAHVSLVIICIGGLIDSNMFLKMGILMGVIVPEKTAIYAGDFHAKSRLTTDNLSFRADINIAEGKRADVAFINMGNGNFLLQELPFSIKVNEFNVDYYDTGMPKNFSSDIVVTNKKTGKETASIIRVNHPLTIDGVTIYQSSFGDGGSALYFNTWNLNSSSKQSAELKAISQSEYPLSLAQGDYTIRFNELNVINIEPGFDEAPSDEQSVFKDLLAVKSAKKGHNIGPKIAYEVRDAAGQTQQFLNYLLPRQFKGEWLYFYGSKRPDEQGFTWLMLPIDKDDSLDTFMALREAFSQTELIKQASENAARYLPEKQKQQYILASDNILNLFNKGGYIAIDEFVKTQIAPEEHESMLKMFYKLLAAGSSELLNLVQTEEDKDKWANSEQRSSFVITSLRAITDLHLYPSPVLMQLYSYEEVQSTGLQVSKSPGAILVYTGSFLLVLGCLFMFYVREKRIWILLGNNKIRFTMYANRHQKDLEKDLPQHINHLTELVKDFTYEK